MASADSVRIPLSQMGFGFYCQHALCPRMGRRIIVSDLKHGERIFVNFEASDAELTLVDIARHLETGNIKAYFFLMNEPVVPASVVLRLLPVALGMYLQNNCYDHPLVHQMPIGIRDGEESCRLHRGFTQRFLLDEMAQMREKTTLCLLCFTASTHAERPRCESALGKTSFVLNLNEGSYPAQPSQHCGKVPVWTFYKAAHESHYLLSPRGKERRPIGSLKR